MTETKTADEHEVDNDAFINEMSDRELQRGSFSLAMQPRNLNEAWRWAKMVAQSDFCPKSFRGNPANVLSAVQMGEALGITPMFALQNIAVINGLPSIWGDLLLAIVLADPSVVSFDETIDPKGQWAEAKLVRRMRSGAERTVVRRFTIEDARKARLLDKKDTPWQTYPQRMLMHRARGWAFKDGCPDITKGFYTREEALDVVSSNDELDRAARAQRADVGATPGGAKLARAKVDARDQRRGQAGEHKTPPRYDVGCLAGPFAAFKSKPIDGMGDELLGSYAARLYALMREQPDWKAKLQPYHAAALELRQKRERDAARAEEVRREQELESLARMEREQAAHAYMQGDTAALDATMHDPETGEVLDAGDAAEPADGGDTSFDVDAFGSTSDETADEELPDFEG